MAPTHLQPDEAETADASSMRKGLKLGDAERIAAERLDGAAEGSLKKALAVVPAGETDPSVPVVDAEPPAGATAALRAVVLAPSDVRAGQNAPGAPNGSQGGVPLTNALDAAVKLAADATAAAEALESLRRLLERQLPNAAGGAAAPAAAAAAETPLPVPLRPSGDPASLSSLEPTPAASATPQPPPKRTLPVPLPSPAPAERRHLDIRGFLAGFALSWAIGAVLYLFMTAG